MGKALELVALESKLQAIFEASPDQSFTTNELASKVVQVTADDLREALWNMYFRGRAEPVQPALNPTLEQRWKLATPQADQLKNRDPKWKVTASGSVIN